MTLSREQVGALIKQARIEAGLSVRQAADQLGIHFGYIGRIERGDVGVGKHATAIADLYGMNAEDLIALAQGAEGLLPNFGPYLRGRYDLSDEAIAELEQHFKEVTKNKPKPRGRS